MRKAAREANIGVLQEGGNYLLFWGGREKLVLGMIFRPLFLGNRSDEMC
jgi:hypothetical protein